MVTLLHPIWLLLAIPLLVSWWVWPLPSRFLRWLRLATLLLILLALCGLAVKLPSRAGIVIAVVDRSLSMPPGSEAGEKEAIELLQRAMSADDRLAVISFGQNAAIDRAPQTGAFAGFTSEVGREASNLSEALEKALALIPQTSPGKIVVFSDGRWTGKDPLNIAARAAVRGVAIDYRSLQRTSANDLAISQLDAPTVVAPGEAFMMTAWIRSPLQQEISYELKRGDQTLAAGRAAVSTGLNRLTFRDRADAPGTQGYVLKIASSSPDPMPENNSAKLLVGVQGPKPLLLVSPSRNSGLARALAAGGLQIQVATPEACEWSLEALSRYSALLLENIPAEKIGGRGMETIAAWVSETGAGLMMTGGRQSYGPGGYFRSPLEPILPVSMELRREHRKLALALVVAMDRSGSMAVAAGGGRTKMDLANVAAAQVLDLLSPMDEFGVVAVDSSSHIIADLAAVENKAKVRNDILRIDSGGGGIFIFEALSTSAEMLLKAKAGTRHIILFADAADSEEPGKYQELLAQCHQAGITVSVIGLGTPRDQDADLLRDIARRGGGQIFFTTNAEELPRLFAQDTFVVSRSAFVEEATPIQFTGGLVTLTGKKYEAAPPLGGYNLCYLRPEANLAAITTDEYKAPVTAAWQAGAGRVLCYTGEADGAYAGAFASWKEAGDFFTSLARWTAGDVRNLPGNLLLTQEVRNGVLNLQLHLDPEKSAEQNTAALAELPKVTTLRAAPGGKPVAERAPMRWVSADTLEMQIPLRGNETALATVEVAGAGRWQMAPVTLPYSPEFKPSAAEEGATALAHLAQATGGKERIELSGVWKDLSRQPRLIALGQWLLLLAVALLLLEILERHTGLLTAAKLPAWLMERMPRPRPKRMAAPQRKPAASSSPAPQATPISAEVKDQDTPPSPEPAAPSAIAEALRQARRQAKERTER